MAKGNPARQKMINMMYLVLTALLALNVSKEVLNSFFEVNKGIERTTTNFYNKNGDTYYDFDNATAVGPVKRLDRFLHLEFLSANFVILFFVI